MWKFPSHASGPGPNPPFQAADALAMELAQHSRLMHDRASLTRNQAILRHAGEATDVINNYRSVTATQKQQLLTFLDPL